MARHEKRREAGEQIDSKNIKKHKNDVFRLLANVIPSNKIEVADIIQKDITLFIKKVAEDKPQLKNLDIRGTTTEGLLEILRNIFV